MTTTQDPVLLSPKPVSHMPHTIVQLHPCLSRNHCGKEWGLRPAMRLVPTSRKKQEHSKSKDRPSRKEDGSNCFLAPASVCLGKNDARSKASATPCSWQVRHGGGCVLPGVAPLLREARREVERRATLARGKAAERSKGPGKRGLCLFWKIHMDTLYRRLSPSACETLRVSAFTIVSAGVLPRMGKLWGLGWAGWIWVKVGVRRWVAGLDGVALVAPDRSPKIDLRGFCLL